MLNYFSQLNDWHLLFKLNFSHYPQQYNTDAVQGREKSIKVYFFGYILEMSEQSKT